MLFRQFNKRDNRDNQMLDIDHVFETMDLNKGIFIKKTSK